MKVLCCEVCMTSSSGGESSATKKLGLGLRLYNAVFLIWLTML